MRKTNCLITLVFLLITCETRNSTVKPWPAEPWTSSKILTHLDPDFRNNMSGVCYNPETETFWVCRNGNPSAIWALKKDRIKGLVIATKGTKKAKYDLGKGDLEGICQIDYDENRVFLMVEGSDKIREYDVSDYGNARLRNEWNISAHVPTKGNLGSEGITFVPDRWLKKSNFTDSDGNAYLSRNGMGGLMFVAHQNGGRVYAFDLGVDSKDVNFVGSYKTSRAESSGLEFDRSTGLLFIWHNIGSNYLEAAKLSSYVDGKERRLETLVEFVGPKKGNLEGIALSPVDKNTMECLIVDDDNQDEAALMWFRKVTPPEIFKKFNDKNETSPDRK